MPDWCGSSHKMCHWFVWLNDGFDDYILHWQMSSRYDSVILLYNFTHSYGSTTGWRRSHTAANLQLVWLGNASIILRVDHVDILVLSSIHWLKHHKLTSWHQMGVNLHYHLFCFFVYKYVFHISQDLMVVRLDSHHLAVLVFVRRVCSWLFKKWVFIKCFGKLTPFFTNLIIIYSMRMFTGRYGTVGQLSATCTGACSAGVIIILTA